MVALVLIICWRVECHGIFCCACGACRLQQAPWHAFMLCKKQRGGGLRRACTDAADGIILANARVLLDNKCLAHGGLCCGGRQRSGLLIWLLYDVHAPISNLLAIPGEYHLSMVVDYGRIL